MAQTKLAKLESHVNSVLQSLEQVVMPAITRIEDDIKEVKKDMKEGNHDLRETLRTEYVTKDKLEAKVATAKMAAAIAVLALVANIAVSLYQ